MECLFWGIKICHGKGDDITSHKVGYCFYLPSPNQTILAAGDVTGRVLIWKGIDIENSRVKSEDDAESCTTLHSHSAEVNILNFSSDGEYLYSGETELFSPHNDCVSVCGYGSIHKYILLFHFSEVTY